MFFVFQLVTVLVALRIKFDKGYPAGYRFKVTFRSRLLKLSGFFLFKLFKVGIFINR